MNFQAQTKKELLQQFDILTDQYRQVISETAVDRMNLRPQGKWSIYQNIDHIIKSNKITAIGYKTPKTLLAIFFGKPKRPSNTTEEVIRQYQAHLAQGAKSKKIFEAGNKPLKDPDALLSAYNEQLESFKASLLNWSEKDLDNYQIQHPILGRITAREMLSFTVYHQFHHLNAIYRILDT